MTTKKFLSAEEVVELYGVDEAVLSDLVKDGSLKALADRGGFKFRRDDIDSLVRAKILHPSKELPVVGEEAVSDILSFASEDSGSSAVDFIELDEEALAEQPTMITSGKDANPFDFLTNPGDESSSDVSVVLEPMETDSSDSDIRLGKISGDTSDSDVKTLSGLSAPLSAVQSDSDVKTIADRDAIVIGEGSDSDVKTLSSAEMSVAGPEGSDSDVKTLSAFEMSTADSGISLESDSSQTQEIEIEEDDGISLPPRSAEATMEIPVTSDSSFSIASDSALGLDDSVVKSGDSSMLLDDAGSSVLDDEDSGITLDTGDSGISLDTGDSGISLDMGDSGISLDAGDSGITLDAGDSGITLSADSGISVQEPKGNKFDKTEAMFDIQGDDFDLADTGATRASLPAEDDELEATAAFHLGADDESATMPTMLGTDDEDAPKPKQKYDPLGFSGAIAAGATIENLEVVDDLDQMTPDTEEASSDAIFADDDEEAEVLEASDESFAEFDEAPADDDMLSEEFEAPVAAAKKAPKEKGWGALATTSILAASVLMAANAWILWEGISTMWTGAAPSGPAAGIISSLAGLF